MAEQIEQAFGSMKVSKTLAKRLTPSRKSKICSKCGCDYHLIARMDNMDFSNAFTRRMINYLASEYYNVPNNLPLIVWYADKQSGSMLHAEISKIGKDIAFKRELVGYIRQQNTIKRELQEYEAKFDETEETNVQKKRKKQKQKNSTVRISEDAAKEPRYSEINGFLFEAIPLKKQVIPALNPRLKRRYAIRLEKVEQRYGCRIYTYYDVTKIRTANHLQFLQSKFGDVFEIAKNLPFLLVSTKKHNEGNMRNAIKNLENRLKEYDYQ
eukprot:CAMPEP_0197040576 /NCGR_PEP_ID=MMETSP1384-20130603/17257_1 /TAXON_ID=29189 /ORGANISM="Ammonia sp." /LENGTH=267 /DNA_ID=CAMNT_0042471357 /DNA_START=110 /DNA_END=913 /DNA_ORIENTATION=-